MKRFLVQRSVILLYALLLAALSVPALAQETAEETARDMVERALQNKKKSPETDLGAWSRSVLERALERAGKNAAEIPLSLPAEDQAGRLAGRFSAEPPRGSEVIVFMSLSVPVAAWREWTVEAARIGAPLVLRGVAQGGLRATVKRVGAHFPANAGAAIDPRLFRLFGIEAVPAVAVVPGGVPPCRTRGCSADPAPPHDVIGGNIGLEAALAAIAREGGPGRETARRRLGKLRGDHQ